MVRTGSLFLQMLSGAQPDPAGRRWLFVPYDQLSDRIGPLSREDPEELGIILIESPWKVRKRPYHKQKLALVMANIRHFALEQAARGVAVHHEVASESYAATLVRLLPELRCKGPIRVMEPAEREMRVDLRPLVESGVVETVPHEGWLTTREQFDRSAKGATWRMDAFYRTVRRDSGILMKDGKPVGGKFSFDAENRRPWKGEPEPPAPPRFRTDAIKEEVGETVRVRFAHYPGELDLDALPATKAQATRMWRWARERCLPTFGPYEDAMSTRSSGLFHTRISSLVNLHRVLPATVVRDVERMDIPLASKEGFIRQVLGWREFVRHVHVATDGFRSLPEGATAEGGEKPDHLGSNEPLPPAYWGTPSGLRCLDHVVGEVWSEGYSHHITRLMILCNLATLLDVSPRELSDWFWVAYTDAYDWVVEPNVLGMGTYAVGDLMTTKPYVSGAAYIDRMSDYCAGCTFHPRKDCPVTPMYWAFLARHAEQLRDNPRLRMPYHSLKKRSPEKQRNDWRVFNRVSGKLQRGEPVTPADLAGGRTRGDGAGKSSGRR